MSSPPPDSLLFSNAGLSFTLPKADDAPVDLFAGFDWKQQQQQQQQQYQQKPCLSVSNSTGSLEEYRFGGTPSPSERAVVEAERDADVSMLSGFSSSSISSLGSDASLRSSSTTGPHDSVDPLHDPSSTSPKTQPSSSKKPSPSRSKPVLHLPPPAPPAFLSNADRRGSSDQLVLPSGSGLNTLAAVRKLSSNATGGGGSVHLTPPSAQWASLGMGGLPASPLRIEQKEGGAEYDAATGGDVEMEDRTGGALGGGGTSLLGSIRRGSAGAQARPALGSRTASVSPTAKTALGGSISRKGSFGSPYERVIQQSGCSGSVGSGARKNSLPLPPALEPHHQPLSPESPNVGLVPLPSRPKLDQHQQQGSYYQHQQPAPPKSPLGSTFQQPALPSKPQQQPASYFPTTQQTPPQTPKYPTSALPIQQTAVAPAPSTDGPPSLSAALLDNHNLNPLFASRYLVSSTLGSGGFGFVCVALDLRNPIHPSFAGHPQPSKQTHREVAVKFILADKVPRHAWVEYGGGGEAGDGMPESGGRVPMECEILRRVRHWGVIRGEGLYFDSKFFYLVQELHGSSWAPSTPGTPTTPLHSSLPSTLAPPSPYAPSYALPASPYGTPANYPFAPPSPILRPSSANMERRGSCDLFQCVEAHQRFSENKAKMIFKQVVETVHYLSTLGIYHRDIKDENLVIDRDFRVKLIDFGSAVWQRIGTEPIKYTEFFGTNAYAAPEILSGRSYHASDAEVWSLGILLCILIAGESPFPSPDHARQGKRNPLKAGVKVSRELADLLDRCLEVRPEKRISLEGLRGHRWLA